MKTDYPLDTNKNKEGSILVAFATGLMPFVAVSPTAYMGLISGVVILIILVLSSSIFTLLRNFFQKNAKLSAYIIITAGVVSIISVVIQAVSKEVYNELGIYLPLMAACVSVIGIGGGSAASENIVYTLQNATFEGAAAILVLFSVGSIREILGKGKWLSITIPNFPIISIFEKAAGGFLVYAVALAILSISLNAFAQKQSLLTQLRTGEKEEANNE